MEPCGVVPVCVLPLLEALLKLRLISQFHFMCFMCCLAVIANNLLFSLWFRWMGQGYFGKNPKILL